MAHIAPGHVASQPNQPNLAVAMLLLLCNSGYITVFVYVMGWLVVVEMGGEGEVRGRAV